MYEAEGQESEAGEEGQEQQQQIEKPAYRPQKNHKLLAIQITDFLWAASLQESRPDEALYVVIIGEIFDVQRIQYCVSMVVGQKDGMQLSDVRQYHCPEERLLELQEWKGQKVKIMGQIIDSELENGKALMVNAIHLLEVPFLFLIDFCFSLVMYASQTRLSIPPTRLLYFLTG